MHGMRSLARYRAGTKDGSFKRMIPVLSPPGYASLRLVIFARLSDSALRLATLTATAITNSGQPADPLQGNSASELLSHIDDLLPEFADIRVLIWTSKSTTIISVTYTYILPRGFRTHGLSPTPAAQRIPLPYLLCYGSRQSEIARTKRQIKERSDLVDSVS